MGGLVGRAGCDRRSKYRVSVSQLLELRLNCWHGALTFGLRGGRIENAVRRHEKMLLAIEPRCVQDVMRRVCRGDVDDGAT